MKRPSRHGALMWSGRRQVLAFVGAAALWPRLMAQHGLPPVVFLMALATRASDAASIAAFRDGMRELGHVEGRSYQLIERYAEGDIARAETMLREQTDRSPAVFLAPGPAAARIILRVRRTVPIVAVGLHPQGGQSDLFASLARPGGMVTGVSNIGEQLAAKRVQLLGEAMPRLKRIGVLHTATDPVFRRWGEETEREIRAQGYAAERLGLVSMSSDSLGKSLRDAHIRGVGAIVVVRDFLTSSLYWSIATICRAIGLAVIAEERRYADAGALMSYGASDRVMFRQAAEYVDGILKGAVAADMPVRQPTQFELVINLGAARALGLEIPQTLLLRADEVIP
jgi:putative tryptophan/tyrosine transport system substrate-binding protein